MKEKNGRRSVAELEAALAEATEKNAQLVRLNTDLQKIVADGKRATTGFDALMKSGVLGVMVAGRGGTVLEANDAFLRIVGYPREELVGRRRGLVEITAPEWREATDDAMHELHGHGRTEPWEKEYIRKDGTRARVLLANVEITDRASVAFVVDLSERKRAEDALRRTEEQLRQAQKMEAIGRLAGGVAHDFNNLLSVILSYGTLLCEEVGEESPYRADLEEIGAAARRAAALTKQLLLFSRQQVTDPQPVDLNEVVDGVRKMLTRTLGEDIALQTSPGDALGCVMADPNHIEQVLMNLVVNARDAMPTGGELTIETRNIARAMCRDLGLQRSTGPFVMLAVKDTGSGMDQQTKAHLFEPFFTTKERGKGTGLGLSTVFGIVQGAGGEIVVESEPGTGTTFRIYFPLVDASTSVSRPPVVRTTLRGTETILLVEDEDQVRAVASSILRRQGYQVIEAKDPVEALRLYQASPQAIHLLLTDVVMPQMSGTELARRITGARNGTRVLCMSGYTDDTVVRHGVVESGVAFLQKPITPESLSAKVREVLEDPRNEPQQAPA
ncbi:MAG: ATP-binding protein [Polyangiaceae bacterium]